MSAGGNHQHGVHQKGVGQGQQVVLRLMLRLMLRLHRSQVVQADEPVVPLLRAGLGCLLMVERGHSQHPHQHQHMHHQRVVVVGVCCRMVVRLLWAGMAHCWHHHPPYSFAAVVKSVLFDQR
jgi:hypothetical protein